MVDIFLADLLSERCTQIIAWFAVSVKFLLKSDTAVALKTRTFLSDPKLLNGGINIINILKQYIL
jgi:hypothetical protein